MKKIVGSVLALGMLVASPGLILAMSHGKELPATEGKALHQYITQDKPYEQWELWPGTDKLYKGSEPHGVLLTTYVNKPAMEALKKEQELPEGSIIVKENYTPDKKLAAVTVMYKKAGYNPEAGDYFWLKYAADGEIEAEGKASGCINCHRSAQGNDWLFNNDQK